MQPASERVIYPDASIRRGCIGIGIVVAEEGEQVLTLSVDGAGSVDSTHGEMLAIHTALVRLVKDGEGPRIVTDSQSLHRILVYRMQVLNGAHIETAYRNRLERWMENLLFRLLVGELERTKAEVRYAPRCSNDHMREADKLAKKATQGNTFEVRHPSDGTHLPRTGSLLKKKRSPAAPKPPPVFKTQEEKERLAVQRALRRSLRDFRGGGWFLD